MAGGSKAVTTIYESRCVPSFVWESDAKIVA